MRKKLTKFFLILLTLEILLTGIFAQDEQRAELVVQTGHSARINSIAYLPDGKIIASGSSDETIKLWDAVTILELQTLKGHTSGVNSIAFSPDGKILASGSQDKTIKLWNVANGRELRTFSGHADSVNSIAFSPDGRTLASGSYDNTIKLWDVAKGQELRTFSGHINSINSVVFSPDGKTLASGSEGVIKLWNVQSGQLVKSFAGNLGFINSVTFSPDGKILASGVSDGTLRLWDIQSGKEIKSLRGQKSSIVSIAFSPDGKILASGSIDKTVKLWDVTTGKEVNEFTQNVFPLSVCFSPDGKQIAYTGLNNFSLADVEKGIVLRASPSLPFEINAIAISPDKKILSFSDNKGSFAYWDIERNERVFFSEIPDWTEPQNSVLSVNDIKIKPKQNHVEFIGENDDKVKARLFMFNQDDWVTSTSNGLFDSSSNGIKFINFRIKDKVISPEQIKDIYYVPYLLSRILKHEPLPNLNLFSERDLFPDIDFATPQVDQKELQIKLKNLGGGIGRVQVLINNKEFVTDARPVGFDVNSKEAILKVSLENAPFYSERYNEVEVRAYNSKNSLRSRESKVMKVEIPQTSAQNIYAIISGISDYTGDSLDLNFAAKDAEDFAKAIELGAAKLLGDKSKVHIRLLTSGIKSNIKFVVPDAKVTTASKQDFFNAFYDFKGASTNDIFIIYLAGYGVSIKTNREHLGGDLYLYLTQEAYTTNMSDEELRNAMAISSEELTELMKQNKALKQVLILDTCAAGGFLNSLTTKRSLPNETAQIRAIERLKDYTGFYVLLGNATDAVSYEASYYGKSFLNYSLLEAMKGAKLREGEFADVSLLFNYAQDRVSELAKDIGGIQRPLIISPDSSRSFDIGNFTPDVQKQIPLPFIKKPIILRPILQNKELLFDNLNLSSSLRQKILIESFNLKSKFVYVDADEFSDAIIPAGNYTVSGEQIEVNLILIKNKEKIAEKTIIGSIKEIADLLTKTIEKLLNDLNAETEKESIQKNKINQKNNQTKSYQNKYSFWKKANYLQNIKVKFNSVNYNPIKENQDDKIVIIRPRLLSEHKSTQTIAFQKGLVEYFRSAYGEGKNEEIIYKDIDELENAIQLEWAYEEDEAFSTIKFSLVKDGQTIISGSRDSRKGDIDLLILSVSRWISNSHDAIKIKSRGVEIFELNTKLRQQVGKQYALLIATDDYDYLNDLKNPVLDVCTIAKILEERYGFETEIAINKTKTEINQILRKYLTKSYEENSELLIFVAGHGSYDRITNMGYLATKDSAAKDDFFDSYIPFPELVGKIDKIPVKHIWLVLDTCNAGLITKETARNTEGKLSKEEFVIDRLRNKTRMALAATEGERYVGDGIPGKHSPFARDFIEILSTDGGADGNGILITSEFATTLFENRQKPRFGRLSSDDEPGSDFVFILMNEEERKKRTSEKEENKNPFDSKIRECKCIFQKYEKEKYNPPEVCEK